MKTRRAEHADATQRRLLRAGRRLFGRRGYGGTGIEEIAARAKVTTGALYHHFGSKQGLFQAVAEELERELLAQAIQNGIEHDDPWQGLAAGVAEMLDATLAPEVRQIVLHDAPRVIGAARWLEIEERYSLGLLRNALRELMENGILLRHDPDLLARALFALTNELATRVGDSKEPERLRVDAGRIAAAFLESLRA